MPKKTVLALLIVVATTMVLFGQQPTDRLNLQSSAQCKLPSGKTIVVRYSSSSMVNETATFVTAETLVTVAGKNIPTGSYTIFTIPMPDEWTLVISRQMEGTNGKSEEFARVPMSITTLPRPVQNVRISFNPTPTGCTMHIRGKNTEASVPFNVKNTDLPLVQ